MKKFFFALAGIVFFFAGAKKTEAQTVSLNDLNYYYVDLRQNANYAFLNKKQNLIKYSGLVATLKEVVQNGYTTSSRYYVEATLSDAHRTAVELDPVARQNARLAWAGKKYGILNPNKYSDLIVVDSITGDRFVAGCGNQVISDIVVSISDHYDYTNNTTTTTTTTSLKKQKKKKQGGQGDLTTYDVSTASNDCRDCGKTQKIQLREPQCIEKKSIPQSIYYSGNTGLGSNDIAGLNKTQYRRPLLLFRAVEVPKWLSYVIDIGGGVALGYLGYKALTKSSGSSQIKPGYTPDQHGD